MARTLHAHIELKCVEHGPPTVATNPAVLSDATERRTL